MQENLPPFSSSQKEPCIESILFNNTDQGRNNNILFLGGSILM